MKRNLYILTLLILFCFLSGCQDKEAKAELEAQKLQAEAEEQMKSSFIYMIEQTDKGNYDAWDEVCSPDYVCRFVGIPEPMNLEEHKQANQPFLVAFPDFKHEVTHIIAKGDRMAAILTITGTHEGEFMGISPTGNKIEYTAMIFARFSEGKIIEVTGMSDMLGLMQQLSMELKPKESDK